MPIEVMRRMWVTVVPMLLGLLISHGALADSLSRAVAQQAVAEVKAQILSSYVLPDDRQAIAQSLAQALQSEDLPLDNRGQFAQYVTQALRRVNGDGHLGLTHNPNRYAALTAPPGESDDGVVRDVDYWYEQGRQAHWGVRELAWLPGGGGVYELHWLLGF